MTPDFKIQLSEFIIRVITLDYLIFKRIIKSFVRASHPKSVLELGCGTGILAPFFSKSAYLGIDIDKDSIEYAKRKRPRYNFRVVDGTSMRLGTKFDAILVAGVIHHLNNSNAEKFIETIDIHLKKDGKVLIIEAIPPLFKWNIFGIINRKMDRGAFIRKLDYYETLVGKRLKIEQSYNQFGGAADYGVLVASKR